MPADATTYRHTLTNRLAIITTEEDGQKRCWQRIELQAPGEVNVTWRMTYNEACNVAREWTNA